MAAKKKSSKAKGRDDHGRFAAGNPGGPGGARRRACEFRRAAEEAVTTEHIQALIRKGMAMALQGDVGAMRFVCERVMGKPADAPNLPEPLAIDVPSLSTVDDCTQAIGAVVAAICDGQVDAESARLLTNAVQARLKAIELTEHDQRLTRLEQAAEDLG